MNIIKNINLQILSIISNLANVKAPKGKIDFAVGGQAVIEGVMMRSPNSITISVRKKDKSIKTDKRFYKTLTQKHSILNIPIIRGVVNLVEMMVIGTKAINFSANESLDDLDETQKSEKKSSKTWENLTIAISMVIGIALSIFLFKFIPLYATSGLEKLTTVISDNYMVFNLIDGLIKASIFFLYIFILTLFPSFKRLFEYHGAEHKSIFAYELEKDLSVASARKQSRFHPRCGTSFVLIVFIISILVYTFVPRLDNFWLNLGFRILMLLPIAGISYEWLKFSAKWPKNFFVKILISPGMLFQRLTTKEPDDSQLETGLKSLSEALEMEKSVK